MVTLQKTNDSQNLHSVDVKFQAILVALARKHPLITDDPEQGKIKKRFILSEIARTRDDHPLLDPFHEKILAKSLQVYDIYADQSVQRKQTGEVCVRPLHVIKSIEPVQIQHASGNIWVKNVMGTQYSLNTPDDLILKLESTRDTDYRIRIQYGITDPAFGRLTGQAEQTGQGEPLVGFFTRDEKGIPCLFQNARSREPSVLRPECLVKLEFANRSQGCELWRHPLYREDDGCVTIYHNGDVAVRSKFHETNVPNTCTVTAKLYKDGELIHQEDHFSLPLPADASPEDSLVAQWIKNQIVDLVVLAAKLPKKIVTTNIAKLAAKTRISAGQIQATKNGKTSMFARQSN